MKHDEQEEPRVFTSVGECDEEISRLQDLYDLTPTYELYQQIKAVSRRANELARWRRYAV